MERQNRAVKATPAAPERPRIDYEGRVEVPGSPQTIRAPRRPKSVEWFAAVCVGAGLPRPVREHKFHPARKWRFDYAWPDRLVAIEVQGGLWSKQFGARAAHSMPLNILRDMEKGNAAVFLGWRVLHYTPEQLPAALGEVGRLLA